MKFERNPCIRFRDNCDTDGRTDGRRTKVPYHELCWQSQAELKKIVWRYNHIIWSGSMQQFPRNLTLRTDDGQTTDDCAMTVALLTKSSRAKMTLTCSRSKIPTWMLHTPQTPKFPFVSLYNELFLSNGPIFGKVQTTCMFYKPPGHIFSSMLRPKFWKSALNDPKWPWHVQDQKYQHACYIYPPRPKFFVRFALRWARMSFFF